MRYPKENLVGRKVGRLTVVEGGTSTEKGKYWKCVCSCGNIRFYTRQNLLKGTLKSCGCFKSECHGAEHKNWKGCGKISASFLSRIKSAARRRGIPFNLNVEFLNDICRKQNGKCALTGIFLSFPMTHKHSEMKQSYNASLDRKDSTKGYTKNNVQWVTKEVNMMKQKMTEKDFVDLCSQVLKFKSKKKLCVF